MATGKFIINATMRDIDQVVSVLQREYDAAQAIINNPTAHDIAVVKSAIVYSQTAEYIFDVFKRWGLINHKFVRQDQNERG